MNARVLLSRLVIASWLGLVLLWLVQIFGGLSVHGVARALTVAALALTAVHSVLWLTRLLRAPASPERSKKLVLTALLAIAFVVRFAGLDFELLDAPIGDEGVFHKVSQQINGGDPYPRTFNYGHLLYYLGALAIWFYDLFPSGVTRLLEVFYTTYEGYGVQRILLKAVNASLAALTAGAVFGAATRVLASGRVLEDRVNGQGETAELLAGTLAGLLIAFSPLYNSIAHQLIADVPAAAFAAFCIYFLARLLRRESLRDYLLAGAASGLAAAGKYPGGVVVIGIFAIWLSWRIRERNWSWSLLWAALASVGSLVAVMPALFKYPHVAFGGEGLDIFFGFRQYAYGGWIGVQPESNLVWYGRALLSSFGWPAIGLGLAGVALAGSEARRRWLWMAVFPVAYLTLIFSMSMVVHRNLQVALPGVAVVVGAGLAVVLASIARRGRLWAWIVALVALALPIWRTLAWDFSQMRPGTRQLARAWIEEHVPEGASIIRERYSPKLDPERYAFISHRFAAWQDPGEMRTGEWDYLVLAKPAYARFVESEEFRREHQKEYKRRYEEMLGWEKVAGFEPSVTRAGPELSIFALEPDPVVYRTERVFSAADSTFISHPDLRRDGPKAPLQYTRRWQFAVFKDYLAAGTYRVELDARPEPPEGYLYVVDRRNREVGTYDLREDFVIELPADEKYLVRIFLPPPTRLHGFRIAADGTPREN